MSAPAYENGLYQPVYTYASGVVPLQAEPLLTWSGASPTSIIILSERSHTVAVVGDRRWEVVEGIDDKLFFKYLIKV